MEAVCPQCHMRYEVGEELLGQTTEIMCPTCQVVLSFVQADENVSANAGQNIAQEAEGAELSSETAEPDNKSMQSAEDLPASEAPSSPGRSSKAQDLLEGDTSKGSDQLVEEPASVESQPAQEESTPDLKPRLEPAPDSAYEQVTEPSGADSAGAAAEETAFETPGWDASPEAPVTTSPEQNAPFSATDSADPGQSNSSAEAQTVPDDPSSVDKHQEASVGHVEDWSEAAARWATSGFSAEHMPDFIKSKEDSKPGQAAAWPIPEDQPQSEESAPVPSEEDSGQASAQVESWSEEVTGKQEAVTEAQEISTPTTESQEQSPDQPTETSMPPPLPKESMTAPPAWEQAPPENQETMQSVYVLRGSGEGTKEEAHVFQEGGGSEVPGVNKQAQQLHLDDEPLMAANPSRGWRWVVLVVMLLVAGGVVAWRLADIKEFLGLTLGSSFFTSFRSSSGDRAESGLKPSGLDAEQVNSSKQPEKKSTQPSHTSVGGNKLQGQKHPPAGEVGNSENKTIDKKNRKPAASRKKASANLKRAVLYTKQGYELIKQKKYLEAVKRFKKALRADPTYPTPHRGLGISYAQLDRLKQACSEYRTYLRMIPPDAKEVSQLKVIIKDCK